MPTKQAPTMGNLRRETTVIQRTRQNRPDINLPDEQKGKPIGRAIHPDRQDDSSNHLIKGGDDEDPRWATFYGDRLPEGRTKDTVGNIAGEIRRRQKAKLRQLGDKEETADDVRKRRKSFPLTLGGLTGGQ